MSPSTVRQFLPEEINYRGIINTAQRLVPIFVTCLMLRRGCTNAHRLLCKFRGGIYPLAGEEFGRPILRQSQPIASNIHTAFLGEPL